MFIQFDLQSIDTMPTVMFVVKKSKTANVFDVNYAILIIAWRVLKRERSFRTGEYFGGIPDPKCRSVYDKRLCRPT
jgi:hypothetical protein